MTSYRVVVMCAGVGERLRPLTYSTNKSLFEFDGKPLLCHFLDGLIYSEANIKSVYLVVGHLRSDFKKLIGSKYHGLRIKYLYNPLYKITGGGQSLYLAGNVLQKSATLIADGDYYIDPDLMKMIMQSEYKNCSLVDQDLSNVRHSDCIELAYGYEGLLSEIRYHPPYLDDPVGKSIIMFKLTKDSSNSMFTILEKYLLENGSPIKEVVTPFNRLMKIRDIHYHLTGGLNIAEIDFLDDYEYLKELLS